jgi:hypothetical protein
MWPSNGQAVEVQGMRWDLVEERLRAKLSLERFRGAAGRVLSAPEGSAVELAEILLEAADDGDPESEQVREAVEESTESGLLGTQLELLEKRWSVESLCEFVWDSLGPMSWSASFDLVRVAEDFTCLIFVAETKPICVLVGFEPGPDPELVGWAFQSILEDNGTEYGIEFAASLPSMTFNRSPELLPAEAVFAAYRKWVSLDWEEVVQLRDRVVEELVEPDPYHRVMRLLRRMPEGNIEDIARWLEERRKSARTEFEEMTDEEQDLVVRLYLALTYREEPFDEPLEEDSDW